MTPDTRRRERWGVTGLVASLAAAMVLAPLLRKETLTIAIHQGVEGVALRTLAEQFSHERNVAVEVFELPYDALYAAEQAQIVEPTSKFDVVMVDDPWLPALIGEDGPGGGTRLDRLRFTEEDCRALELSDFVESTLQVSLHPAVQKVHIRPAASAGPFTCDDPFFALPFVGNSQLFVTRADLQPATWDEVMALTLKAAESGDAGYVARVGAGNSVVTDFMPILWSHMDPRYAAEVQTGGPGDVHDPLARSDDKQGMAALEFLRALGDRAEANRGVVSVDDFDLTVQLVQKQASMSIAWAAWVMAIAKLPQPYNTLLTGLDRNGHTRLNVTQVPGEPVLGAWLLAIPARSARKDLAQEFLVFATSRERIIQAARRGNPPPRRSAFADQDLAAMYAFFPKQLESLERARMRPRTPLWRDIEHVLGECLTTLYENVITTREAWERVEAGLDPIRDKERRIAQVRATPAPGGQAADEATTVASEIRSILDEPLGEFSCQQPR